VKRERIHLEEDKPEQDVTLLRQFEIGIANGKASPQACQKIAITQQTYLPPATRMQRLETSNAYTRPISLPSERFGSAHGDNQHYFVVADRLEDRAAM
jgi:hypothetical protein